LVRIADGPSASQRPCWHLSVSAVFSSFNNQDCKGLEHSLHQHATPFDQVFFDEMLPHPIGTEHVKGITESQTCGVA
jgi:hypothetical protein